MAAKAIPAPIDRPLARAYLREFSGWSTAYPPGVSDSSSLREMHNCSVAEDSSLRIRPGLRRVFNTPAPGPIIGDIEPFYTTGGVRALLFACRVGGAVVFRTAVWNNSTKLYHHDPTIATRFPGATDAGIQFSSSCTYVRYVQIDNKILALSNNTETMRMFWVGSAPKAKKITAVTVPAWTTGQRPTMRYPAADWISGPQTTVPTVGAFSETSLVSSTSSKNQYNFAYFYTFNNEVGETAASQLGVVRAQRPWSAWIADPNDDTKSADQLVAIMPESVYDTATSQGAISWNLYMLTWSDQSQVPVEGVLIKTVDMVGKTYQQAGWASHTPLLQGTDVARALPTAHNRDNFSDPSTAGNGLVAGDRLVLIYDQLKAARITWSSNLQGEYLNFSASKGGGFKTLTSGNLHFPAAVKLWQNPQSVDTITVLCSGLDGNGTAFYMTPGTSTTTQSQATLIMGFEETTATPGTVSPYGVEVLNNALYHPLDNNLMKSTAANYNINHKLMADPIQNIWHKIPLKDKRKIVSSQMDSTLYYIINSPAGWYSRGADNGNQVWLCDTGKEGTWSVWDVPGSSLRKLEVDGLLYMSITQGPNLFVFDPEFNHDDVWSGTAWVEEGIPWSAVTNTQGANRAHDAWAQLQQVNVTFGNFTGECVYGIRGKDVHGQPVEVSKHLISTVREHDPVARFDQEDYLLVRRIMKEWEFFWRSADKPKNRSFGSISYLQYRYTPVSVNVGYEYGSVETFEYGARADQYSNGVPLPFADTSRP